MRLVVLQEANKTVALCMIRKESWRLSQQNRGLEGRLFCSREGGGGGGVGDVGLCKKIPQPLEIRFEAEGVKPVVI